MIRISHIEPVKFRGMKRPDNRRHGRWYFFQYGSDLPFSAWGILGHYESKIHRSEMVPFGSVRRLSRVSSKDPFHIKWVKFFLPYN